MEPIRNSLFHFTYFFYICIYVSKLSCMSHCCLSYSENYLRLRHVLS